MRKFLILFFLSIFLLSFRISCQDSVYHRANEWKEQLQAYYKQDAVSFPEKGQILFVGSSSIGMWKNLPGYFSDHKVFGRGFGGSRMSDLLYHMQRLVIDYKPAQIVLYCGENDISNGVSPQDLLYDVKTFVRIIELQLPGVPILILSIKPSPLLFKLIEKQKEANKLIAEFCQTKNHLRFIDITKFMVDESGSPRKELFLPDGLHVNTQAYCTWAQAIEKYLIK
jgi:lysophospholipase L1-like esterase